MKAPEFIYRFVPAAGSTNRTLLLLHGTGGNEDDLLELGRAIDSAAALLSPRGKVLENGAPRFFRRLAEGVFDEPDVIARANELAEFVDAAANEYEINPEGLVAVGYSNGANIAAAMLLLDLAKFRQAILLRAIVPLSKINPPNLKNRRVFISAGEFDPIARVTIASQLAQSLETMGADVTLKIQPAGHELTSADLVDARRWLDISSAM